jgi:uncharacterized protein (DUF2267 family)
VIQPRGGSEVNYPEFIDAVARRAGVSPAEATTVTRATLETLTDRITEGQAHDIAGQLPVELREHLHKTTSATGAQVAERFGIEEFVHRVSARAGVDTALADTGMRAALTTVGETISSEEREGTVSQLPKEFWDMIKPAA